MAFKVGMRMQGFFMTGCVCAARREHVHTQPFVPGLSQTMTSIWSGGRGQVPAVLCNKGASRNKHHGFFCNECSQAGTQQGVTFRKHKAMQDADQTDCVQELWAKSWQEGAKEACPLLATNGIGRVTQRSTSAEGIIRCKVQTGHDDVNPEGIWLLPEFLRGLYKTN